MVPRVHDPMIISQVARSVGLRASTLRYYEQIGLLPPVLRQGGQRRYDSSALQQLAVVLRAKKLGFTLDEIRRLFSGFRTAASASHRWRALSVRKLAQLENQIEEIRTMQRLLRRMVRRCRCRTLAQCGRAMIRTAMRPTATARARSTAPGSR